jgi:hypothetical protein
LLVWRQQRGFERVLGWQPSRALEVIPGAAALRATAPLATDVKG